MEKESFINKFCVLKPEYIETIRDNVCSVVPTKVHRPYLIVELLYRGKLRLFAIPTQTSIKKSLDKRFWHKLPSRLETKRGMHYGLLYSTMIPIPDIAVKELKGADTVVPKDLAKRQDLLNTLTTARQDAFSEKAQAAFAYMKKESGKMGASALNNRQFKLAYRAVSKTLHYELLNYKDANIKRIKAEAQAYLTNHYEATVANRKKWPSRIFVDMPKYYTNISSLATFSDMYESQQKQSSLHSETSQKRDSQPSQNETLLLIKEKLLELGKSGKTAELDAKILAPLAEKELHRQRESLEQSINEQAALALTNQKLQSHQNQVTGNKK